MADFQWRTDAWNQAGEGSGATVWGGSSGAWWDGNGSGGCQVGLGFTNYYKGANQRVNTYYSPSWSISWDANNRMKVTISARVDNIDASSNGVNPGITGWHMRIRNKRGGSVARDFDYDIRTSGQLSGAFNVSSFSFTVNPGATSSYNDTMWLSSWSRGYGNEGNNDNYTDNFLVGVQFKNNRSWNYDTPKITAKSCAPATTAGGASMSVTADFGATRPSAGGTVTFAFYKDAEMTSLAKSVTVSGNSQTYSGTTLVTGLQPNTRYYVKYTASNGSKSATATCTFVTLATNTITSVTTPTAITATGKLIVQNGNGVYKPSTRIQYKKCSASSWSNLATTSTTASYTISMKDLDPSTCYQLRAITTTTAGSYTGNVVTFTTPDQHLATAKTTSIDSVFQDDEGYYVKSTICYKYESEIQPANVKAYYRMEGETAWILADEADYDTLTGEKCFTITELQPNLVTYELKYITETEDGVWESDIETWQTPLMENPYNYICDNLEYLLDLLCQAIEPLKEGNKTIYANPASKELCDPYSENPTFATLWSRILRFDHAAACVICNMKEQELVGTGDEDQYWTAEAGWVKISQEVEEDGETLVSSKAIKDYLEEELKKVWHFQASVDYLAYELSELPTTGLTAGDTAIITSTSKQYEWSGTKWEENKDFETVNFSVFHINNELKGTIYVEAGSAWYYFEGTWNNLDADTRALEARVDVLEDVSAVEKRDADEDDIYVQVVNADFDYDTLPDNRRTLCFVTEGRGGRFEFRGANSKASTSWADDYPNSHNTYTETGKENTFIEYYDSMLPYTVATPTMKDGYTFAGWTCAKLGVTTPTVSPIVSTGTEGTYYFDLNCSDYVRVDINCYVDGKLVYSGFPCLFDLYKDGTLLGSNINDYGNNRMEVGTVLTIKNIRPKTGYTNIGDSEITYTVGTRWSQPINLIKLKSNS